MSPVRARPRTLYFLIVANTILAAVLIGGIFKVEKIQGRLDRAEDRSYTGCLYGNVLRRVARHAMTELGDPESMRLVLRPELKPRPCGVIYPGGKP